MASFNMDSEVAIACINANGMLLLVLCVLTNDAKEKAQNLIQEIGLESVEVDPTPYNQYQKNLEHPIQDTCAIAVGGSKGDYQRLIIVLLRNGLISDRVFTEISGVVAMIC
jgi:hypothetical protein